MDVKERNKKVKKAIKGHFVKTSVTGGKGTSYGWCHISVDVNDPCPFKQHESPCSRFCDGICKGNNKPIDGGWGNTVRQEEHKKTTEKIESLIKGIEFSHFYADDGYDTKLAEVLIDINFV